MKRAILTAFICAVSLSGCMLGHDVMVGSFVKPSPAIVRMNYTLVADPKMPDGTENDLRFLALKAQVIKVLASKGFVEVSGNDVEHLYQTAGIKVKDAITKAEMEGRSGCTTQEMESVLADCPVIVYLWYKVLFSNGPPGYTLNLQTQNFGPFENLTGEIVPHVNTTATSAIGLRAWDTTEQLLTEGGPIFGPEAVDALKNGVKMGKITWGWKVLGIMFNSSGDIQRDFPYLLAAIKPYIGTNTGKEVEIRLTGDDKRVIEINHILERN